MKIPDVKKPELLAAQIVTEIVIFGGLACMLYACPLALAGIATTATSLTFKIWGQPAQLLQLYRLKSSKGLSVTSYGIAAASYICWSVYGLRTGNWVILGSQLLGVVGSLLMLHLVVQYRLNRSTPKQGVLFWLWNRENSTWQRTTSDEYIVAFMSYRLATSGSEFNADPYDAYTCATPGTSLPVYWSAQINGELLQGMVTDTNISERPPFAELVNGMMRLNGGSLVYSTENAPARVQYVINCV